MSLKVVEKRYAGKRGITSWLLRLVGSKAAGPYDYYFNDGYVFRPYSVGINKPEDLAARGCSDPTGAKFQPYVDAAGLGYRRDGSKLPPGHYVNWLELDHG